eukprot:1470515-Amphidinium_carterae.1
MNWGATVGYNGNGGEVGDARRVANPVDEDGGQIGVAACPCGHRSLAGALRSNAKLPSSEPLGSGKFM